MMNSSAASLSVRPDPIHRVIAGQPHACGHYEQAGPRRISLITPWFAIVLVALHVVASDRSAIGQEAADSTAANESNILDDPYDFSSAPILPKIEAASEGQIDSRSIGGCVS